MSLKDRINNARNLLELQLNPKAKESVSQFDSVQMAIAEVPRIIEKKGFDWVLFGEDNLYPLKISDLKYGSPIHNAIVSTAGDMIAGDGFLINDAKTPEESLAIYSSLTPEVKAQYDLFLANENDPLTTEEVKQKSSFDFKEQGACAFEVVYNHDFTKITRIKYVDVKNVRAGKMENDVVKSYWYSRNWAEYKKTGFKPVEMFPFNTKDKEHLNQLVYLKRGSLEYYGECDYAGALYWIQTDFQMGIFHLSNLENGMNPSLHLQFYKLPRDEQDKQDILRDIRKSFVGANKTGKHMVSFSDGKELAPKYEPIQANNLDKQLLNLAELCDRKILTGHKLTSPLLAGISVSGQLGGNLEIEKSYWIYDRTRIAPYRKPLDTVFNKILDFNKTPIKIKTNPWNPFNA